MTRWIRPALATALLCGCCELSSEPGACSVDEDLVPPQGAPGPDDMPPAGADGVPHGPWVDVMVSDPVECGLRQDGALQCWAGDVATSRAFVAIDASPTQACALRDDDRVFCWGPGATFGPDGWPSPGWTTLVAGDGVVCGADDGGSWSCSDPDTDPATLGLDPIVSVAPGGPGELCGLDAEGRLACTFEALLQDRLDAQARYERIAVLSAAGGLCGLTPEGALDCYDGNAMILTPGLEATYREVALTTPTFGSRVEGCVLGRSSGYVGCWGYGSVEYDAPTYVPFEHLSVGPGRACGLDAEGTIQCWGDGW